MQTEPPTIEMNVVPVRRAGICCHELDGEAVLYDPAQHALHYLNTTAYFIWSRCDGRTTVREFLRDASNCFATEPRPVNLDDDLLAGLAGLRQNGLLDWGRLQTA